MFEMISKNFFFFEVKIEKDIGIGVNVKFVLNMNIFDAAISQRFASFLRIHTQYYISGNFLLA